MPPPVRLPMRLPRLDALRGFALLWMIAFHFAFDLAHLRLIEADFYRDPVWTGQRIAILSLFLVCAGLGQAAARAQGQTAARFARRWLQIAGAALLVSAGSWLMFGPRYIHFGVLHGMALMLPLARWAAPLGHGLLPLAVLALGLPLLWTGPDLAGRGLDWLGLMARKPSTEDHVPLLPWLGPMLLGLWLGQCLLARAARCGRPGLLGGPLPVALQPLARLGRWSLSVYLLHQPLLMGGLMAGLALTRGSSGS